MGKISDEKTRYALTLEKETKKRLEKEARKQKRSLNNLIEVILDDYLAEK